MQQLGRLFVELARQTGMNFLLQQAERHGEAVQGGGGRRRAARNIDIDRYDFIGTAPDAVQVVEDAAAVAAGAVGDTDLRIRRRLPGAQRRERIARVTAPVNSRISAWRGEGTTLIPKRSASNSGERVAKISISQPLQPPQSTR
jgi:hypothetical protein